MGAHKETHTPHAMTYILTISQAWPTKQGRKEQRQAIKSLEGLGFVKIATNTFRGFVKDLDSLKSEMSSIIPHAANWHFFEIASHDHIHGANF